MIKWFVKMTVLLAHIPIYWLSRLLPKDPRLWIFGSWFGDAYSDNSKYLFEYASDSEADVRPVWISRSKGLVERLQSEGREAYLMYSLKGYWMCARAGVILVTTGIWDVNRYTATGLIVLLWHGSPLKHIKGDAGETKPLILSRLLFPFNSPRYKLLVAASNEVKRIMSRAFYNVDEVMIAGYPRNDGLLRKETEKRIIYMPTHRGQGDGAIHQILKAVDFQQLNGRLRKLGRILVLKLHYYDMQHLSVAPMSNIEIADTNADIYEELSRAEILVTDYSSVYFDFLLTGKPVIFAPFDFNEYVTSDRQLYFDYDSVTPGPKCKNWDEILDAVEQFVNGRDEYAGNRSVICRRFNANLKFGFSSTLFWLLKKKVGSGNRKVLSRQV